jgi:hypothetical protein
MERFQKALEAHQKPAEPLQRRLENAAKALWVDQLDPAHP